MASRGGEAALTFGQRAAAGFVGGAPDGFIGGFATGFTDTALADGTFRGGFGAGVGRSLQGGLEGGVFGGALGGGMGAAIGAAARATVSRGAAGMRAPVGLSITRQEAAQLRREFAEIGGDPRILRFNHGRRTGYVDAVDRIDVRGDVLPLEGER